MKESRTLEFKEKVTNTFLKTVSAFANFETGEIRFGVNDKGENVGIRDPERVRMDIENRINDSIRPKPDYHFIFHKKTGVLSLIVEESPDKPYLYKGKAYRRSDTATVEVDNVELKRLTLIGMNRTFEQLPAAKQNLTFSVLQGKMSEILGVNRVDRDILKTLNLYDNKMGYNNAAALVADRNQFPGIDMVRFGESIDVIKNRKIIKGVSVLTQYDEAAAFYVQNYQEEVIDGMVLAYK